MQIQQNVEEFIKKLNDSSQTGEHILQFVLSSQNIINSQQENASLRQQIVIHQTQLTKWLKTNIQSYKTAQCYQYSVLLYNAVDLQVLITPDNYYNGQEEEEKNNKEGGDSQQQQMKLNNQYLYLELFLLGLSHLQSLVDSKKVGSGDENVKQVLFQVLSLLSLYAEEREIQAQCRRQKLLKVFLKIFQDIFTQKNQQQQISKIDIDISHMVINLLAKITFKNRKNQDYVIKKKGYELVKGILITAQEVRLYQSAAFFLTNCCYNTDARLLLWVAGVVKFLKERIVKNLEKMKSNNNNKEQLQFLREEMESSLILLHRLCSDTREISEEVINDIQYMDMIRYFVLQIQSQQILESRSLIALYGSCIGILRKIAGIKQYRAQIISEFFINPVEFFKQNHQAHIFLTDKILSSYVLKELLAILGVFAIDEESRTKIVSQFPTIFSVVIKTGLGFLNDAKLVKTAIGCLTNFSVLPEIRNNLSKEKDFYVLVYNIVETYDFSVSLLEYTLKMVLNASQNELCFQNFSAPKFVLKLIFLSFIYQTHFTIITLLIKIFRVLSQNDLVLQTIVKCAREYEISNREFKFSLTLVEGMKAVLNPQPDIIMDIILFVAVVMQVDREFIQEINDKTQFVNVLKEYIDRNRNDQQILDKISQCVAYLPIEDFKTMLSL